MCVFVSDFSWAGLSACAQLVLADAAAAAATGVTLAPLPLMLTEADATTVLAPYPLSLVHHRCRAMRDFLPAAR